MNAHVSVDYINDMIRLVCLSVCLSVFELAFRQFWAGSLPFPSLPSSLYLCISFRMHVMSHHVCLAVLSRYQFYPYKYLRIYVCMCVWAWQ